MKEKRKNIRDILKLNKTGKLIIKINTLENENETLKSVIKDELYKTFMEKLNEPMETKRLKEENRRLRKKIKIYKEIFLKEKLEDKDESRLQRNI